MANILPDTETISNLPSDGGPEFNRLIFEQSPYLLQHARNPVDWHPWGEEAFALAREQGKPVFLSVGYSTCHWCHVMEHESFEDETVAALLSEHYVCIKVDREERPDIDAIYMTATQLMTQRGGWPNSVWLLADGRPWFAGTYFPPEDAAGRPGFKTILTRLHELWTTRKPEIEAQANQLAEAISRYGSEPEGGGDQAPTRSLVDRALNELRSSFDAENGGFGGAPKFPPHQSLELLLGELNYGADPARLELLTKTLDAMALGGIHDHVGGGFHRYSTDARWFLPHFEKMLYDNAQLLPVYAEAWRITGKDEYAEVARGIAGWVIREMSDSAGGFHSALDADSEGEEGKFYLWSQSELNEILGDETGERFGAIYGSEPGGNYRDEATGHAPGTNLLHLPLGIAEFAEREGLSRAALADELAIARQKLLGVREARIWPHRDDKVLAAWNGLMIGGLARAGELLGEPSWIAAAERAADFVMRSMVSEGRLLRSYRSGIARLPGYLDDYAFVARGLLDLHAATGDAERLAQARRLADRLLVDFGDEAGGFYFTANDHEKLLRRSKDPYDGAVPAGNGVAAQLLFRLAELTGEARYRDAARSSLRAFGGSMNRAPRGTLSLLQALVLDSGSGQGGSIPAADGATTAPDAIGSAGPLHVEAYLDREATAPGGDLGVALRLWIDEGWHVNSQSPLEAYLAPTVLAQLLGDALNLASVKYPEGSRIALGFSDSQLSVYSGEVWIAASLSVDEKAAAGRERVELRLDFQACDESRCLAPAHLVLALEVEIDPDAPSIRRNAELFE